MAKVQPGSISGVQIIKPDVFGDSRGSFFEIFRSSWVSTGNPWAQWNVSRSSAGVVRGLHFHKKQTDYWHLVQGRIHVAMVDMRPASPTFRTPLLLDLKEDQPCGLVIPPGVAHGYKALTDMLVMYLLDQEYDGADEHGIRWDDPELHLPAEWYAGPEPVLSKRDATAQSFGQALAAWK